MTALYVEQRGSPTLHEDEIGHVTRAYLVEDAEQPDDKIPTPVIIDTPETFQLVRILPRIFWRVRHLFDHHNGM